MKHILSKGDKGTEFQQLIDKSLISMPDAQSRCNSTGNQEVHAYKQPSFMLSVLCEDKICCEHI